MQIQEAWRVWQTGKGHGTQKFLHEVLVAPSRIFCQLQACPNYHEIASLHLLECK